jgi:spermidine synthase
VKHLPLYAIVSISGAAVLALEILGTRLLGPFYGVSIFLWSALISVALAALATGYALGGRWADRGPTYGRLAILLALTGIWVLLTPWMRRPILTATEALGLRTAVLTASFLLFFPPLTLLGMVSPYAIRLKASSLDQVGRTAGDLYAVSTVASVVAAVMTGFVLIPHLGVNRLILLIGAFLLGAAGIAWFARDGRKPHHALLLLVGPLLTGALWSSAAERPDPERGLVALEQSAYAELRVLDTEEERSFLIDGGIHTRAIPGSWGSVHRYAVVTDIAKNLFPASGRMLLVGLGGGSVAKSFAADGWDVDAVEIDPGVTEMARRYFDFNDSDATVVHMDGRRFLSTSTETWDLIVMDAFGSSAIPFHLVTREAFGVLAERLDPQGVLAVNVETVGWNDPILAAFAATIGTHFDHVVALPTAEPPDALGNIIILASRRDMDFPVEMLGAPRDYLPEPYMHWVVVQRNHAWDNRFVPDTSGAPILTDDLNPVDLWAERINRVARKELHDFFKEDGLSW